MKAKLGPEATADLIGLIDTAIRRKTRVFAGDYFTGDGTYKIYITAEARDGRTTKQSKGRKR